MFREIPKAYVLRWLAVFTAFWYLQATTCLALIEYLGTAGATLGNQYLSLIRWYETGVFVAYFATSLLLACCVAWLLRRGRSSELVVVTSFVAWVIGYFFAAKHDSNPLRTLAFLQGLNFTALIAGLLGCALCRRLFWHKQVQS